MAVSLPLKVLTAWAVPSPEERSIVPVTVLTKTHNTSQAKEPTSNTLIIFFAWRTHLWSASRVTSDSSSLYSWDVAMTAPATNAAGAPKLQVQSKAPVATSKTSAADAFRVVDRGRRGARSVSRGPVKAWVAAAINAVRASMVNQVAASRFDGVLFAATASLAPIYKLVLLAAGVSLAGWLLSYNWGTLAASRYSWAQRCCLKCFDNLRAKCKPITWRAARLAASPRLVVWQSTPPGLLDR